MDSSIWIGLIGVCGTLAGAFFGAWLNPYMQEKKEIKRLKTILKEASLLDKFIIFNAYKNVYLPLNGMIIFPSPQLDLKTQQLINLFNEDVDILYLNIKRLADEGILFIEDKEYWGCRLVLSSKFCFLINQDKEIQRKLLEGNKSYIKEMIYPLYELIMQSDAIFKLLQQNQPQIYQQPKTIAIPTTTLANINIFMHNIYVFNILGDLSYLNPASPTAYLSFPKREFHPKYEG
ncbi:hypothetical protein LS72_008600 [Helicobacter apodemus]|uniref:Uncharacterized protein n=1 Tax=Helicobacter apodemus TaxID=135569 RepID=A0A4V6I6F4_9HELI|nr:hypothetical protein [Helicobacter apodemus]TLE14453.1 hypothetical protein LS72_008600 [Helicobacter apodemus]